MLLIHPIEIPVKTYEKVQNFLVPIYNKIPKTQKSIENFSSLVNSFFVKRPSRTVISPVLGVPIELSKILPEKAPDVIYLNTDKESTSMEISPVLGVPIELEKLLPKNAPDVKYLNTDKDEDPFRVEMINPFTSKIVEKNDTKYLFVYTDIIEPRRIASNFLRMLKVISVSDKLNFTYSSEDFVSLDQSFIENISIAIMDSDGKKGNFNSSLRPIYINLHFKKQK